MTDPDPIAQDIMAVHLGAGPDPDGSRLLLAAKAYKAIKDGEKRATRRSLLDAAAAATGFGFGEQR